MSSSKMVEAAERDFLEKVEMHEEKLKEVQGGNCAWWNISCQLGNDGRFCTYSAECQAGCNV